MHSHLMKEILLGFLSEYHNCTSLTDEFCRAFAEGADRDWRQEFKLGYDLAMQLAADNLPSLRESTDRVLAGGHLFRLALEAGALGAESSSPSQINVQQPAASQLLLLKEPVSVLQGRLQELLSEWPENPLLEQLTGICNRILSALPDSQIQKA